MAAPSTAPTECEVAAAWLAEQPGATTRRLQRWFAAHNGPLGAADALSREPAARGAARVTRTRDTVRTRMQRRGTRVLLAGDPDWPFHDVPAADQPALLFAEGDGFEALTRPAVSIVGTRAATPHGLADAREIAAAAARAGYVVVSGLAIGIDTAAHEGALAAGGLTIGVVATGLDVVYPRRNAALFDAVRASGLVVGEYGFGTPPEKWRFPVRNRIIAALGAVTVVVEAKARGGALVTARLAMELSRDVLAVPGSRRNGSAAGTNALLRDGAHVLTEPADLFVALGRSDAASGAAGRYAPDRLVAVPLSAAAAAVLDACGGEGCTLDEVVTRSALPAATVAGAIRELERVARIQRVRGLLWPT
jgi:DNA processing protein